MHDDELDQMEEPKRLSFLIENEVRKNTRKI